MQISYKLDQSKYNNRLDRLILYEFSGTVTKSVGLTIEADLPGAAVGNICELKPHSKAPSVSYEVIGFVNDRIILMPLQSVKNISPKTKIKLVNREPTVKVSDALLGRVLNGLGQLIDGKGAITNGKEQSIYASMINPMDRVPISKPLDLGVRSINAFATCGCGQRMSIMAGSGVGKSILLGMIARYTKADVNVIAFIGERGREVREYIETELDSEGLKRSVVIVATSEESPLLRVRASHIAMAVAEYFSDKGKNVLLLMDSLTRFCMAQREIGLSLGEPPTAKGYTPSVFSVLPQLIERAGNRPQGRGSITALYTVLVEGDELDDPISDSIRSFTDGHIVLSRALADKGHYPAVDVTSSISRVMRNIISEEHSNLSIEIRELLSTYLKSEDLINIGAYAKETDHKLDRAIALNGLINNFLKQKIDERTTLKESVSMMKSIVKTRV